MARAGRSKTIVFFDIDKTLNRGRFSFRPKEPAVSREFWNMLHDKATVILVSRRPNLLEYMFVRGMRNAGWKKPDYTESSFLEISKVADIKYYINKVRPKLSIFVGNSRGDCESALKAGCRCIRYTRHDKSKLNQEIEKRIFSSANQKEIEKRILKIMKSKTG